MKLTRGLVSFSMIFALALVALPFQVFASKDAKIALQRGYRTGYSDGYMSGYRDSIDGNQKAFAKHAEYTKADRAYNRDYGTIEDYRDGYQQGFEIGYDTGFEKKSFDAVIPESIAKRGIIPASYTPPATTQASVPTPAVQEPVVEQPAAIKETPAQVETQNVSYEPTATAAPVAASVAENNASRAPIRKEMYVTTDDPVIIIPRDTEIIVELDEAMDTERTREGDKFTAKVISPVEIAGATVEGHVDKVTKPGRIKRRSELTLSFDRMIVSERRWTNFDAILTEVLPVKGDNVKLVDQEGTAVGKGSLKSDAIKVGAATGTGLTIGAITGGPVGAAVGAGVGAAFGVGAVVVEKGKHIKLNRAQQLRIKTSYETQIR